MSKGTVDLGDELLGALGIDREGIIRPPCVAFTPLEEIHRAIERRLEGLDLERLVQAWIDRARGRV